MVVYLFVTRDMLRSYLTNADDHIIYVVLIVHAVDAADDPVVLHGVHDVRAGVVGPGVEHSLHTPRVRITCTHLSC